MTSLSFSQLSNLVHVIHTPNILQRHKNSQQLRRNEQPLICNKSCGCLLFMDLGQSYIILAFSYCFIQVCSLKASAWMSWKLDWMKLSRVLVEFWRFTHDEKWMTWGVRPFRNMESMSSRQILQISNTIQLIPWYQKNNHTVHVSSVQTSSMNQSTQTGDNPTTPSTLHMLQTCFTSIIGSDPVTVGASQPPCTVPRDPKARQSQTSKPTSWYGGTVSIEVETTSGCFFFWKKNIMSIWRNTTPKTQHGLQLHGWAKHPMVFLIERTRSLNTFHICKAQRLYIIQRRFPDSSQVYQGLLSFISIHPELGPRTPWHFDACCGAPVPGWRKEPKKKRFRKFVVNHWNGILKKKATCLHVLLLHVCQQLWKSGGRHFSKWCQPWAWKRQGFLFSFGGQLKLCSICIPQSKRERNALQGSGWVKFLLSFTWNELIWVQWALFIVHFYSIQTVQSRSLNHPPLQQLT